MLLKAGHLQSHCQVADDAIVEPQHGPWIKVESCIKEVPLVLG